MMNINSGAEEHLRKYEEIFSKPSVSSDEINSFIASESMLGFHKQPEYCERYTALFELIRDRIILANAGRLELAAIFENLSLIVRASGIKPEAHPKAEQLYASLLNALNQNEPYWQLQIIRTVLIIKTFTGQDWREEYIRLIFDIPSASLRSIDELKQQAKVFVSLFPSCAEMMRCLEKNVFNASFFNKPLRAQKSCFMWIAETSWLMTFKESPEHMEIIPSWFRLFQEALRRDDRELVFCMHMPLSHIYLNMCHTQEQFKVFNDEVEMPLAKYIQKNMRRWGFKPVKKKMPETGARKIAFVYDRIVDNSPAKLLISLLTYLKDEKNIKLYVYDMGYVEKSVSNPEMVGELKALGAVYVNAHDLIDDKEQGHYYLHFEKAVKLREKILADDIDVIVTIGNKMPSGFLLATRTAPLQIYWDHGNHEYDYKNIDKRICHFNDGYKNEFEFERFSLPMLPKYLTGEGAAKKAVAVQVKQILPPHKVVLGSIGRIMKLSDEYIETVSEILRRSPDAIYLACGSGGIDEKKEKVKKLGVENRFIFTGYVDAHVYGHVIDVYLNTFPLSGGESISEFVNKDGLKYVVTLNRTVGEYIEEAGAYINDVAEAGRYGTLPQELLALGGSFIVTEAEETDSEIQAYASELLKYSKDYSLILLNRGTESVRQIKENIFSCNINYKAALSGYAKTAAFMYKEGDIPGYAGIFRCEKFMLRPEAFSGISAKEHFIINHSAYLENEPEIETERLKTIFARISDEKATAHFESLLKAYFIQKTDSARLELLSYCYYENYKMFGSVNTSLFDNPEEERAASFVVKVHIAILSGNYINKSDFLSPVILKTIGAVS